MTGTRIHEGLGMRIHEGLGMRIHEGLRSKVVLPTKQQYTEVYMKTVSKCVSEADKN